MPQLGPAFLHRPITGVNLAPLKAGITWLIAGMRAWAPGRFLKASWKPRASLYSYTGTENVSALGLVESSWAGETKLRSDAQDSQGNAPAWIVLSPSLMFETGIELPEAARNTLQKTIALRLPDLSPIPPDDASYAIGDVRKVRKDRIEVKLAIVRKAVLRAVHHDLDNKEISRIGASPDANGAFEYVFFEKKNSGQHRWKKQILAAALLWCALLFLAGAFEIRASKALTSIEEYQSDLRQELKVLQETKDNFARLQQFAPPSLTLGEASMMTKEQLEQLPDDAVLTRLLIDGEKTLISGLAPEGANLPESAALRRAEEFPGFQFFEFHAAHDRENAEDPAS